MVEFSFDHPAVIACLIMVPIGIALFAAGCWLVRTSRLAPHSAWDKP